MKLSTNKRMDQPRVDFIAAGGNRHPAAADWDCGTGLVAYASDRNVSLWKPLDASCRGVHALLCGHADSVNAVRFFKLPQKDDLLILTGSADKTIRLWAPDASAWSGFSSVKTLDTKKSVNTIATLPEASLFASGSASAEMDIWSIHGDFEVTLAQTIPLKPKFFPLAIAFALLPFSNSPILAIAGSKSIIQLFVSQQNVFSHIATLTGHEGWIRSLEFISESNEQGADLLLASASQDKYTRLWRIHQGTDLPVAAGISNDLVPGNTGKSLSNKAHRFESSSLTYTTTFEALLLGHEDWIYTTRWSRKDNRIRLLTASADNSLAIWEADALSGVWICTVRLGNISAQKGATTATGSTGGFWIGLWSPNGEQVISLGRTGSWRLWRQLDNDYTWVEDVAVTGHTRGIQGVSWARDGSFLLSTSTDQTTRLFAQWRRLGMTSWHEFSRPQIHGYNLNCIDAMSSTRFISGADEKLLRVFDEPNIVAQTLTSLCGSNVSGSETFPDAASVPVLGLSNQALTTGENGTEAEELANGTDHSTSTLPTPPFEDHLARHLLWPEIEKLYGHGYEISAVSVSNDGMLVATACRASSIDHAVIRLYDSRTWIEMKPTLTAHSLTVTRITFSPDDRYLLSVGRDRQCAVFERGKLNNFDLCTSNPKAHSRMILDASWAPDVNSRLCATAGRDKNLHLWTLQNNILENVNTLSVHAPIMTVCFVQRKVADKFVVAYGLEDGSIFLSHIHSGNLSSTVSSLQVNTEMSPSTSVSALSWRPPRPGGSDEPTASEEDQLAVASQDSTLRIYTFHAR